MDRVEVYAAFDPNIEGNTGEFGSFPHRPQRPLGCSPSLLPSVEEDSPYPEVRSAVANFDDPEMPASTLRSWTLGILISILIPGMNQFFHFRYPCMCFLRLRPLWDSL